MVAVLTAMLWEVRFIFEPVNIALLYLIPVLVSAVRWGLWPSFLAAGIGLLAFDYFFVPPIFSYTVGDLAYLISFAVFLAVATLTAGLATQLKQRAREATEREKVTYTLYALSRHVAAVRDVDTALNEITRQSFRTFGLPAAVVLPAAQNMFEIRVQHGFSPSRERSIVEPAILRWVYTHAQMAGYGTRAYSETSLLYVPLKTETKVHGVLCIGTEHNRGNGFSGEQLRVIEALAGLAAVCIARIHFEEEAQIARVAAESERLRTALLDSISHELRTPLATIMGAITGMIESAHVLSSEDQRELLSTVRDGAMRMNRLVTNLLGMVRLESGMLRLNKHWCDISDMIGVALGEVQDALQHRRVHVSLPDNLPAIYVDDVLLEQVLVNLLSNAIKYSPDGSEIYISAKCDDNVVFIEVRDTGIGIRPEEAERIFEKFYRSDTTRQIPGTGLGLAICKGIVDAHGGNIRAQPAKTGGTIFTIQLPADDAEHKENTGL